MAFSYSDENFTVLGNLCFVHIILDGTKTTFDIPPAIVDRMIFDQTICTYPYFNKSRGLARPDFGFAFIESGEITCTTTDTSYLSFYFPIDSNK